ncbi:dynein light chain Tctex-type protein 2B-like [Asterias amurensis]|uniref:dynein light chain Tctex-type protein 2B-like n=1 Tax=Asterias amurensis TaxID=7602 RepID=UPI003AB2B573
MEKLRAKLLMPTVVEDSSAGHEGSDQPSSETAATPKPKLAQLGRSNSKLATWNLLKRKISFTASGKGVHMGSPMLGRSKRLHSLSSTSEQSVPKMENTFRITPDDKNTFKPLSVQQEIADVLEGVLGSMEYNPITSGRITTRLSEAIKVRVKALQFKRHKLVVHVLVGSHDGQSMELASRCLWNQDTDSYASASYQNTSLFAIASVYGVYYE